MKALRKFRALVLVFAVLVVIFGAVSIFSVNSTTAKPPCNCWVMYCTENPPYFCWCVCTYCGPYFP